ncbi:MAG: serine protease AprX [Clostridium sp.]|jgi:serine protease AprX
MKHKKIMITGIGCLFLATLIGYPKLFNTNVTLKSQYSDTKDIVEVIVQKTQGSDSQTILESVGGILISETPIINGFVAKIPSNSLTKLDNQEDVLRYSISNTVGMTSNSVKKIKIGKNNELNHPEKFENTYRKISNADHVSQTGKGVTIAILDSGVGSDDFSKTSLNVVKSIAINPDATTPDDLYGHGTHVAGIINGKEIKGVKGIDSKQVTGIAPEANLINVKLGDDEGNVSEVDLLLGLQWVYTFKNDYNIKVVNLSVSSDTACSYIDSPLSAAVEQLWLNGVTVVAAAGNDRINPTDIDYAPANDPYIITVGAVDSQGNNQAKKSILAQWSKYGVTAEGIHKPEIMAPGVDLISLLPEKSAILAIEHPEAVINNNYFEMSGTSMAAPVVSGTIALMLEENPSLTPNDIKSILLATDVPYQAMTDNTGVIDAKKAIELSKNSKKLAKIPKYNNEWPLSSYMVDSGTTIDWTKASWRNVDWTKASWRDIDWTKASWRGLFSEVR